MTEWAPVPGWAAYLVSDDGRVYSMGAGQYLKPSARKRHGTDRVKHYAVNIGRRVRRVHHLVLEAFVGPRPSGLQACHWDGDPSNNALSNLRWDTPKANQADSARHGTKQTPPINRRGMCKRSWLNEDDVRCIRAEPPRRGAHAMLARCFGVDHGTIVNVRRAA